MMNFTLNEYDDDDGDDDMNTFTTSCVATWTRTHVCDRSFTVVCRRVWNMLPASLRFGE